MTDPTAPNYAERIKQVQQWLATEGRSALLVTPSTDLRYLTGLRLYPSERLVLLTIPAEGVPTLIHPAFERDIVEQAGLSLELVGWSDGDDPYRLVDAALSGGQAAVAGTTPAQVFDRLRRTAAAEGIGVSVEILADLRRRKTAWEIAQLESAARLADSVVAELPTISDITSYSEADLAAELRRRLLAGGADPSSGFGIAAAGANAANPHHRAGAAQLQGANGFLLDFGATVNGYHSDTSRTFAVGEVSPRLAEVHAVVLEANRAATAAAGPGVPASAIDAAARQVIVDAGYGAYFTHRTGHGIGLDIHEEPYIVRGNDTPIQVGDVFSIEPGIYIPGELGVRIEDIVAVAESGVQVLNQSDRSLVRLG